MTVIALSPLDLGLASLLVVLVGVMSWKMRLQLERQLFIAGLRTTAQLLLVGQVLKIVFSSASLWWISVIAVVMLGVAGREVMARQQRRMKGWYAWFTGTGALCVSSLTITIFALIVLVGNQPWYAPQYAIPLLGMLIGNTMTGIALSLDRLTEGVWQQQHVIEQRLMLGQTSEQAAREVRQAAMRSGMIPIINSMAAAGIVSLPGMMTGQILGGSPPMEAVKYQILIMFLIAAGTGFGIGAAMWLSARKLFDDRHRLRLDILRAG